jgi:hypothetical protein
MRAVSRRALVLGAAATAAAAGGVYAAWGKPAAPDHPQPIAVSASRITHFLAGRRDETRFGALTFEGGLDLRSPYSGFGGFSGLALSPDGSRLIAISDAAQWLEARLVEEDGRIVGLAEAEMGPLLGSDGRPLAATRSRDTESLAMAPGLAYVGIEAVNTVLRFEGPDPLRARGVPIPVPPGVRALSWSKGLEALALPASGPLAGTLIGIAERSSETTCAGFLLTGRTPGEFVVRRFDDFDATDLAPLPDGDLLLLERRFRLLGGVAMRLRRLSAAAIRPGAVADGPVLIEADMGAEIDNMEGLAVHRGSDGALRLTMISDDNFSLLQRTLLLRFRLEA